MSAVRIATEADLKRLCQTAVLAFANDPVMRWLYPDDNEFFANGGAVMRFALRRWMTHEATFTTDDGVALAAFVPPGRPEVDIAPESDDAPKIGEELLARFAAIGGALKAHTPAEPHWYLNLLGTHPNWQRQGLGELMMSPIVARCDTDGLPLWLETETVANVAYYQRFGFTVKSEWDVPLDGPHMWGMQRNHRLNRNLLKWASFGPPGPISF